MKNLYGLFITVLLQFSYGTIFCQNALDFDGVNDYVQTDYVGILGNEPRSIEAWIKTTANAVPTAGGLQQTIVDWGMFTTGGRFTFNVLWSNAIRVEVGGNGVSGTIPVNDGQWHHVVATFDPTQTDQIKLYVDGQLDVAGTTTVAVNTQANIDLTIGRRVDGINPFTGTIDEVRIWDIALDEAQILLNMNKEICDPSSNLVAYYTFNQGIASGDNMGESTLFDISGNNYHGTLNGFSLSDTISNWVDGSEVNAGDLVINESTSVCDSYNWLVNDSTYITSGNYQIVLPGLNNCDTVYNLNLSILPTSAGSEDVMSCVPYTWAADGMTYSTSGVYTAVLSNADGCDSTATLNLDIQLIDNSISQNGITLASNVTGAMYQWVDCDNNFAALPNEIGSTFTPTISGNYAVEISQNGCTVTSDCISIEIVSTNNLIANSTTMLFPNPSQGDISILMNKEYENISIKIYDTTGRKLTTKSFSRTNQIDFKIVQPKGLYIVVVENENKALGRYRVLKE